MALKQRQPRKRASITSLIDVIFLLLLFFMLSSTFSRFSEIDISVAERQGGASTRSAESAQLVIEVVGVSLGDEQIVDEALLARLRALAAAGTTTLTVVPEDAVVTQRLIDVLTLMSKVPGLEINLIGPAP